MPNILGTGYPQRGESIENQIDNTRTSGFLRLTINDLKQLGNGTTNFGAIQEKKFYDHLWSKFDKYKSYFKRKDVEEILSKQQREKIIVEDGYILLNIQFTYDQIWLKIIENQRSSIKNDTGTIVDGIEIAA